MYERFTDNARRAVVEAQEAAREYRHVAIAPEHLLYALTKADGTSHLLVNLGIDFVAAKNLLAEPPADVAGITGHIPFQPNVKKVLELALREALQLGHNYITTRHLLLALAHLERDGGTALFADCNVEVSRVRTVVIASFVADRNAEATTESSIADMAARSQADWEAATALIPGLEIEPDMVNHPRHYLGESPVIWIDEHPIREVPVAPGSKKVKRVRVLECIEVIRHIRDMRLATAMKYIWRVAFGGKGNDREDIAKAIWYLNDWLADDEPHTADELSA